MKIISHILLLGALFITDISCSDRSTQMTDRQKTKDRSQLTLPQQGPDGKVDWHNYFEIYYLHYPEADTDRDGVVISTEYTSHKAKLHKLKAIEALGEGVEFFEDVTYVSLPGINLNLDIYQPVQRIMPTPLIVWIHGGGWRGSSKDHCLLSWLSLYGYTVASVEFRSTAVAPFPNNIFDIKAAVRWLKAHSNQYYFDDKKIIISGHSSGGHLAALIATSGNYQPLEGDIGKHTDQSTKVQGLISIAGALYLNEWAPELRSLATIMGLNSDHPDIDRLANMCSPENHISHDDPPALFLHGTLDQVVPPSYSKGFHQSYLQEGLMSNLHIYDDKAHGHRFTTDEERKPILDFLKTVF